MAEKGNYRHRKRPTRPLSMDGVLPSGSFNKGSSIDFQKNIGDPSSATIDNFARPEGFNPGMQPVIPLSSTRSSSSVISDRPRRSPTSPEPAKSRKTRKNWRKIFKRTSLMLLSLIIIGAAFFAIKVFIVERRVFKGGGKAPALSKNIDINKLKGEGDGRINILLLGIGGPGHDGPDLTDTILLVSIDPINHQAALLSIPRDLWVKIPGNGTQKINAAYVYGKQGSKAKDETTQEQDGLNLLDQTLETAIGIPIHYHAVVDFKAFKDAVSAVGGVTLDVPEQLYDPTIAWENHGNSVIAQKGLQTMGGDQALLYARSRETSTDFARSQRQRALLLALKDKALSLGTLSNPVKVSSLLSSFGNNVYTDFSLSDMMRLKDITTEIPSGSIVSLDFVTPPHDLVTTGNVNNLSIVKPKLGLFDYTDIQNYVRNALKDGFILSENANVTILNGTSTAGLATKKATELKSYGYNVGTVADAPTKTYQKTILVALKDGSKKYTQHYLEARLNTTAVTSVPDKAIVPGTADFVIILGADETNTQ